MVLLIAVADFDAGGVAAAAAAVVVVVVAVVAVVGGCWLLVVCCGCYCCCCCYCFVEVAFGSENGAEIPRSTKNVHLLLLLLMPLLSLLLFLICMFNVAVSHRLTKNVHPLTLHTSVFILLQQQPFFHVMNCNHEHNWCYHAMFETTKTGKMAAVVLLEKIPAGFLLSDFSGFFMSRCQWLLDLT